MKGNALVHFVKYFIGAERPNSQTTKAEREALKKYASKSTSAVEIGVYEGVNTILIANSIASSGTLYGIDPFFKGRLGISYHEKIAENEIRKSGLRAKVKLLPFFSYEAKDKVPDLIDLVFIDGDHSYEGIKRDWEDWKKKVKHGGIIALHDTSIPSHDEAVSELGSYKYFNDTIIHDRDFKLEETVDSLNILRKINPAL